jgi:hypothetical protein
MGQDPMDADDTEVGWARSGKGCREEGFTDTTAERVWRPVDTKVGRT